MEQVTMQDFARLEQKVDRLAAAVEKLILVEERQSTQAERIKALETKLEEERNARLALQAKVDMWINRGIGMWSLVCIVGAVVVKVWP